MLMWQVYREGIAHNDQPNSNLNYLTKHELDKILR